MGNLEVDGYSEIVKIYESNLSVTYKAKNQKNDFVIIKVLKDDYPELETLEKFQKEYEITHEVQSPYIRKVYEYKNSTNKYFLFADYIEDPTLKEYTRFQKVCFKPFEFLELAIEITKAIEEVHQLNIIHKDINGNNILINEKTKQATIIDFGISTKFVTRTYNLCNPEKLEGTLSYISPEQTGRMNRYVDYRSDLYSLGITFYEMFAGELPFQHEDPMELVHCHIAVTPESPYKIYTKEEHPNSSEVDKYASKVISDIIMKLLFKNAEERYQSAYGLKYDLELCFKEIQNGTLQKNYLSFKLGENDFSQKLQIPQKLYGRELEIVELYQAYDEICNGEKKSFFIDGFSGTGKTALVQELFKALKLTSSIRSYFVSGKFDQLNKNIPYFAWAQTFKNLINFILTENDSELNKWKIKLLNSIGNIGKTLIEVIPNIELVTGELPEVPELQGLESENRFNYAFKNFIRAVCTKEHPMVLFIDDFQWADPASLKLLKMILSDSEIKYLLFIGAYRSNEVNNSHPFMMTLNEFLDNNFGICKLTIHSLNQTNIMTLLKETLQKEESNSLLELSRIVYDKTQGNAFFVNQFLKSLHEDDLLKFSYSEKQWIWELEKIKNKNITDNVVELVSSKVLKLQSNTIELLKLASCIGNVFDIEILSYISGKEFSFIRKNLEIALIEQMIFIVDTYTYKFVHDKVQMAAYNLILDETKKVVHLQIGRLLLKNIPKEKQKDQIFEIVNQLNMGIDLIEDTLEKSNIIELNIQAGHKAKNSTAYTTAYNYFQQALSIIPESKWSTHYQTTLNLYSEIAEVSYLSTNFDVVIIAFTTVTKNAKTELDKVSIYIIMILAEIARANFKTCLNLGLEILGKLGLVIPTNPSQIKIAIQLIKVELKLRNINYQKIISKPQMTDPHKLALVKIMQTLNIPAYLAGKEMIPILALKQVYILACYGNIPESVYSYLAYAFIVNNALGDIERGNKLAMIILKLVDTWNPTSVKSKTVFPLDVFIRHWKDSLRFTYSRFMDGFKLALETGDLETASNYLLMHSAYNFYAGVPIPQVQDLVNKALKLIREYKRERSIYYLITFQQILSNMVGESSNFFEITGKYCNEKQMLDFFFKTGDFTSLGFMWYIKAFLYFHKEEYMEALVCIKNAEAYMENLMGVPESALILFYDSLTRFQCYETSSPKEKKNHIKKINSIYKKVKKWNKSSESNFLHRKYIIEAETFRIQGKYKDAKMLYDKAIDMAHKNEYLQEKALFYELAGKFYLSNKEERLAAYYLENAHKYYKLWGFLSKVTFLEQKYSEFIIQSGSSFDRSISSTISSTKTSIHQALDLNSVIKASQALSGEIDLESLLYKMIRIVIENGGAEKGLLILPEGNNWYIEAKAITRSKEITVLESIPVDLNQDKNFPVKVISYVLRTNENVVLNSAIDDSNYSDDPYIQNNKTKSILCIPLLKQKKLVGILYLENNLAYGVFTSERLEILNILSSQMGVSIENARLYDQTIKLNKAYERFVPRQFLELLDKKSIIDVKLGDQIQKEMTILFSDIRSFTKLSEKMTPQENFNFINSYLSSMEPIIDKHQGFIDKYIGDAIMALFPISADQAIKSSIEILKELKDFNNVREKNNKPPIDIGIGLNTGTLMLGTVGGSNRMDGTVISDSVNLASRIEGLTKIYKSKLLISEYTYYKLSNPNDYLIRFVDRVRVKGKTQSVSIFEVFDIDNSLDKEGKLKTLKILEKAMSNFFFLKLEKAKDLFAQCIDIYPEDKLSEIYLSRCNEMMSVGDPDLETLIEDNISWFDEYSISVPEIDKQHEELFSRLKDLISSVLNDNSPNEIKSSILFFENYTINHFTKEEEIMRQIKYPDYEYHKKLHEKFIIEINYLKSIEQKGSNLHIILRIKNYITDWILNHILRVDRELGKFINQRSST